MLVSGRCLKEEIFHLHNIDHFLRDLAQRYLFVVSRILQLALLAENVYAKKLSKFLLFYSQH